MNEIVLNLEDNEWEKEYINHDRKIVRAIVFDDEANFYFVRISRNDDFGNATYIETSGGGVEENEDLIEAIKRELKEELGANVKVLDKIGFVSDYYNIIHRHNLNHYYLCKLISLGNSHMTDDEINKWHLKLVKFKYEDAVNEYEKNCTTKIARLVYNREIEILKKAKEIIDDKKYL